MCSDLMTERDGEASPAECEVNAAVSLSNAGWKRRLNLKAR